MKQLLISNAFMKTLHILFILLILAKGLSYVAFYFLPKDGKDYYPTKSYVPVYQRVDFKNMLQNTQHKKQAAKNEQLYKSTKITNMLLKGLYGTANEGFVIIALKSSPEKTTIISVGDMYQGYKLKEILPDGVIFEKNSRNYILKIKDIKKKELEKRVKIYREIQKIKTVPKQDILYYKRDPNRIWKDITINEIRNGKKIIGFRVDKIKKGSIMAELGLKKGDMIIMVNNRKLQSYKDAFDAYEESKNLSEVRIVVLRNNLEREFIYEVN